MTRMVPAIALGVVRLFAQGSAIPSPIAITGDASQIFFASNLQFVGSTIISDNIYKYSGGQASSVYPGMASNCGSGIPTHTCTMGSAVTGLQVSSDGATLAVGSKVTVLYCDADCQLGLGTGKPESTFSSALVTSSGLNSYNSISGLSRNGRFVLHDCSYTCSLTDLVEGGTQTVPFNATSVANDGTTVSVNLSGALSIWNPQSGVRTVALDPALFGLTVIDPLALHAAVVGAGTYIVDLSSDMLTAVPAGFTFSGFSDSGTKILLTRKDPASQNQAFLADINGTNLQQVTSEPTGIGSPAISSDASILVAVNSAGDVLRYDVAAGTREVIFSTPPLLGALLSSAAPGSAYTVQGVALAGAYAYAAPAGPLPTTLGGVQVLVDGAPAPLIAVGPSSITLQLPWESTLGTHVLTANRPVNSPFYGNNQSLLTVGNAPAFVAVVHEDWTPITPSQPAKNGEVLHFYMTGLGPVTPPIATGEITPAGPLFLARSPNCQGFRATFDVLFAGLAPGLAGIYQVDAGISGLAASIQPYAVEYECGNAVSSFYAQAASN